MGQLAPIARTWAMTDADRERLAAYNRRHHSDAGLPSLMMAISREWLLRMAGKEDNRITSVGGLAVDLGMMTAAEAEPAPLSDERIAEDRDYARFFFGLMP